MSRIVVCVLLILVFGAGVLSARLGVLNTSGSDVENTPLGELALSQNKCLETKVRYAYFGCMTEELRPVVKKYGVGGFTW